MIGRYNLRLVRQGQVEKNRLRKPPQNVTRPQPNPPNSRKRKRTPRFPIPATQKLEIESDKPLREWLFNRTHTFNIGVKKKTGPQEYSQPDEMSQLLAHKKSSALLRRKRSDSDSGQSSNTPTDQKNREAKSAPNRDALYTILLATKGSFRGKYHLGISETSKKMYQNLLVIE